MARPAQPQKRRELARKAIGVLQREGLSVSMSHLSEVLEIKRPTLLYHLPTKAHIIEIALEDLLVEQAGYVIERVGQHEHPIDRLIAHLRAVHAFHHGREHRVMFLSQAIAAVGSERLTEIIDVGNRVFEMNRKDAADRVRRGIESGIVHPCDVDALMAMMRAMSDGLVVQRVMTGIDLDPVHAFLWERVLLPLKREPEETSS